MALTLDATLLAAQSSQTRHPICDLIVRRSVDDLPLPKNPGVSPVSGTQSKPCVLYMPDGRIAIIFIGASGDNGLTPRIIFSDTGRTIFSNYVQPANAYSFYGGLVLLDAIVMNESGDIGIVFFNGPGWNHGMFWMTVNSSGTRLGNGVIWSTDVAVQSMSLAKKTDGTFILTYIKPGNIIVRRTSTNFTSWSAELPVYGG